MNAQPPPPLPTAAAPAAPSRCQSRCGCVPFLVFLLALVCALSFGALRWIEPKEEAGRVVMEFLEQNSEAEMKAHAARVTSGEVLNRAVKLSGTVGPQNLVDDLRDRLARHTEVSASGPHLTITVHEHRKSPAEQAGFLAHALNEDLVDLAVERMRRVSQNLEARINLQVVTVDKARLERNDLMAKHDLMPAKVAAAEQQAAEFSARLAKSRADLVMLEARLKATPEADPARAALAVEQAAMKAALEEYTVLAAQSAKERDLRLLNRSELDAAQVRYDSALALLQKLRMKAEDLRIREGVVRRPTRVISEARTIPVPARKAQKFLQLTAAGSAVLLAALLLSAFAAKLLRRSA
jgi:hypothetical protein